MVVMLKEMKSVYQIETILTPNYTGRLCEGKVQMNLLIVRCLARNQTAQTLSVLMTKCASMVRALPVDL